MQEDANGAGDDADSSVSEDNFGLDDAVSYAVLVHGVDDPAKKLGKVYETIANAECVVERLEVRKAKIHHPNTLSANSTSANLVDILVCFSAKSSKVTVDCDNLSKLLHKYCEARFARAIVKDGDKLAKEGSHIWYPKHISELDNCVSCISKFDPTNDKAHPVGSINKTSFSFFFQCFFCCCLNSSPTGLF